VPLRFRLHAIDIARLERADLTKPPRVLRVVNEPQRIVPTSVDALNVGHEVDVSI